MCTPDLRGSQGTFSHYTHQPAHGQRPGGRHAGARDPRGAHDPNPCSAVPPTRFAASEDRLSIPLTIRLDPERATGPRSACPGRASPWLSPRTLLALDAGQSSAPGPACKIHGICRFYLNEVTPEARPLRDAGPDRSRAARSSHRASIHLLGVSRRSSTDRFGTLGLAEDTWALNEGVIDEDGFLEQAYLYCQEREATVHAALEKPAGVSSSASSTRPTASSTCSSGLLDPYAPRQRGKETAKYRA